MREEVPVISTNVGGIPEIIMENRNGMLVKPGNPKELAAEIMKLLNNQKMQQKLKREGKETVKKFSVAKMVKQTSELYQEIFKRK
jgi:glycosyltransferase involved in cell wall biosynthesis